MPIRKIKVGNTTFFTSPIIKPTVQAWEIFQQEKVKVVINCMDQLGLAGTNTPIPYVTANIIETEYWGYMPFYLALQAVLDFGKPAVFHCRAGITRSMSVAATVMYALEKQWPDYQEELTPSGWKKQTFKGQRKLEQGWVKNRIPKDIVSFLSLQLQMPGKSACQVLNALHARSSSKNT